MGLGGCSVRAGAHLRRVRARGGTRSAFALARGCRARRGDARAAERRGPGGGVLRGVARRLGAPRVVAVAPRHQRGGGVGGRGGGGAAAAAVVEKTGDAVEAAAPPTARRTPPPPMRRRPGARRLRRRVGRAAARRVLAVGEARLLVGGPPAAAAAAAAGQPARGGFAGGGGGGDPAPLVRPEAASEAADAVYARAVHDVVVSWAGYIGASAAAAPRGRGGDSVPARRGGEEPRFFAGGRLRGGRLG